MDSKQGSLLGLRPLDSLPCVLPTFDASMNVAISRHRAQAQFVGLGSFIHHLQKLDEICYFRAAFWRTSPGHGASPVGTVATPSPSSIVL